MRSFFVIWTQRFALIASVQVVRFLFSILSSSTMMVLPPFFVHGTSCWFLETLFTSSNRSARNMTRVCVFFMGGEWAQDFLLYEGAFSALMRLVKTFSSARAMSSLLTQIFTQLSDVPQHALQPPQDEPDRHQRGQGAHGHMKLVSEWSCSLQEHRTLNKSIFHNVSKQRSQGEGFAKCLLAVTDTERIHQDDVA